ncbi:hypothetical protein BS78_10G242500 [Paspalum vaginatum]|nr:hypothetical protein BS78_10G242500 [Paspalum vaginatum]
MQPTASPLSGLRSSSPQAHRRRRLPPALKHSAVLACPPSNARPPPAPQAVPGTTLGTRARSPGSRKASRGSQRTEMA